MEAVRITYCCNLKLLHSPGRFVVCPECLKIARFPSGILRKNLMELGKALVGTELDIHETVYSRPPIWHLDAAKVQEDLKCLSIYRDFDMWRFYHDDPRCLSLKDLQAAKKVGKFNVTDAKGSRTVTHV